MPPRAWTSLASAASAPSRSTPNVTANATAHRQAPVKGEGEGEGENEAGGAGDDAGAVDGEAEVDGADDDLDGADDDLDGADDDLDGAEVDGADDEAAGGALDGGADVRPIAVARLRSPACRLPIAWPVSTLDLPRPATVASASALAGCPPAPALARPRLAMRSSLRCTSRRSTACSGARGTCMQ